MPETLSARASARADVLDAESMAAQAQQELADLMGTTGNEDLPLASDRPHVGGYNTYYEEIFNNRVPPARIRLIHRMLPIRRKAIDAHAEAILAALDAIEATGDEFQRGNQTLVAMLTSVDRLKHERRIFIAAVRDYNQDIAEYLFAVVPPGTSDKMLVSKLILSVDGHRSRHARRLDDRSTEPAEGAGDSAGRRRPGRRVARRTQRVSASATWANCPATAPLYQGLVGFVPRLASKTLWTVALGPWAADRRHATGALANCLGNVAASNDWRRSTAYWEAREQAARAIKSWATCRATGRVVGRWRSDATTAGHGPGGRSACRQRDAPPRPICSTPRANCSRGVSLDAAGQPVA